MTPTISKTTAQAGTDKISQWTNVAHLHFPEIDSRLLDTKRRVDLVFLVDAEGVFNGDPDNEGMPRIHMPTGRGLVTDVAVKRIARDTMAILQQNGYPPLTGGDLFMANGAVIEPKLSGIWEACGIAPAKEGALPVPHKLLPLLWSEEDGPVALPESFSLVQDGDNFTLKYLGGLEAADLKEALAVFADINKDLKQFANKVVKGAKAVLLTPEQKNTVALAAAANWLDVRLYGGVLVGGPCPCGSLRGPVQFESGYSIGPLDLERLTLSTSIRRRSDQAKTKDHEFGSKPTAHYALYRINGFINAALSHKTRLTAEDLRIFYTSLIYFGRFHHSSVRPHIATAAIYAFVHTHALGNAHAHELFERIKVSVKPGTAPTSYRDYDVVVHEGDMPEGVELVRLYERKLIG